jgi:BirA family transcriptional regulator, biotin operon repressor / biotin---[acetyl-CoA-carboxylase] ligase
MPWRRSLSLPPMQALSAAAALLNELADGLPHPRAVVAERCGLTVAELAAGLAELEHWGLSIADEAGTLRLASMLDLLDADTLLAQLRPDVAARVERLEVATVLDSTNARLLCAAPPAIGGTNVCIAEYQRLGRGRLGRRWHVPPAGGLCLSAAWHFDRGQIPVPGLALAAGVAARRAIAATCGVTVGLKWPNDLVWDGRKLGGLLVESAPTPRGSVAVVGIGINVRVDEVRLATLSDWPGGAVDLAQAAGGGPPERSSLAAAVITELVEVLDDYARRGLAPYRAALSDADWLHERRVIVVDGTRRISGYAAGIDSDGALIVDEPDGSRRRVLAGDVSVRTAE